MKATNYYKDHRNNIINYGIASLLFAAAFTNILFKVMKLGEDRGMEYAINSLESVDPDTTHKLVDKFNNG